MKIGEIARRSGLSASAIRYYEKAGLMPVPRRASRQRNYDPEILARLRIIRLARDAGFTIRETRVFLSGFSSATKPAARWHTLATKKLAEIDRTIARVHAMRRVLKSSFRCACPTLEDCERAMARKSCA
jgi:MerR family transcriptional regulator, redox-sensitive transcriptional activator SoxR